MNITELHKERAFGIADYAHSGKSIFSPAKSGFEVPLLNNLITAKGFSDGSLASNIPIIRDALGQWAKQAKLSLSPSDLNSLSGLLALKLYSANIAPGSKDALDLQKAIDTLSTRLLPLGTQLSYNQFADKKPITPLANSGASSTIPKKLYSGRTAATMKVENSGETLPTLTTVKSGAPSSTLKMANFGTPSTTLKMKNSEETLSNLKKDIVHGVADPDTWQKKFQAELPKIPGWSEAPLETVEKFSKYCLSLVRLLNLSGRLGKNDSPQDQSEMIDEYQESCDLHLKELSGDLNKWISRSQTDFPWESIEKPEAQGAASGLSGDSLDSMLEEFSIRLISDNNMAGQGNQKKEDTGKYIDVQLTPASSFTNSQGKDDSYACIISSAQQIPGGNNNSMTFGGITNPSSKQSLQTTPGVQFMGSEDPSIYPQPSYGIGPLTPGAHGGHFRWGMGNYGGLYRSLLILGEKLVNDFESYCNGINADQFDMKAAAEFQVKTMQFVTTFGAIMKAISGALKQAKSVVDAVQA